MRRNIVSFLDIICTQYLGVGLLFGEPTRLDEREFAGELVAELSQENRRNTNIVVVTQSGRLGLRLCETSEQVKQHINQFPNGAEMLKNLTEASSPDQVEPQTGETELVYVIEEPSTADEGDSSQDNEGGSSHPHN